MASEIQPGALVSGFGFQHAVAGFGGAAALGDHQGQGLVQAAFQRVQDAEHAVGVGVVEEIGGQDVALGAEGFGHELGAQGRAADADQQQVAEGAALASQDRAIMDFLREFTDAGVGSVISRVSSGEGASCGARSQ